MAIDRTGARPAAPVPDAPQARQILRRLRDDDVDGAIEGGLAHFVPLDALDDADNHALADARDRLLAAWAARERHRARTLRLERIACERKRMRSVHAEASGSAASTQDSPRVAAGSADSPSRPALPTAAAAALARARARASGGSGS